MLINDLDLRVIGPDNTVYFPWTLDSDNPADKDATDAKKEDPPPPVLFAREKITWDDPLYLWVELTRQELDCKEDHDNDRARHPLDRIEPSFDLRNPIRECEVDFVKTAEHIVYG